VQAVNKSSYREGAGGLEAAAADHIRQRLGAIPKLALVLGTGFAPVLQRVQVSARIASADIPGFAASTVPGHAGELVGGTLGGLPVVVLSGRIHYYEGHTLAQVAFPVRALATAGVETLLLTNAAGGINPGFAAGDYMVLKDHINFMGDNPLRGPARPGQARFIDLTQAYDPQLSEWVLAAGRTAGLRMHQGVYLAVCGPSYETPAEIRAFAALGADAVGMSTVPEVIVARQCGLRVAAISCISNLAAGQAPGPLDHLDVIETGRRSGELAGHMLELFAENYARHLDSAPTP
jgi:purine-nucleoside phosphorylase